MTQQTNIRMLAAVMFADIVGFTKMMQDDEQKAKFLRDRQRTVIYKLLIKYHGQVMQYYGDGILIMFGSALDAVNIASRVQALGISGSVMMSGKAMVYLAQKKYNKSLRMIKKYAKLIDSKYRGATHLAFIYARMGEKALAEEYLNLIKEREKNEPDINLTIDYVLVYAAMGNKDLAFEYLQKGVDMKLGSILMIYSLPIVDDLRDDPRYQQIVEQIGLPNENISAVKVE